MTRVAMVHVTAAETSHRELVISSQAHATMIQIIVLLGFLPVIVADVAVPAATAQVKVVEAVAAAGLKATAGRTGIVT